MPPTFLTSTPANGSVSVTSSSVCQSLISIFSPDWPLRSLNYLQHQVWEYSKAILRVVYTYKTSLIIFTLVKVHLQSETDHFVLNW